MSKMTMQERVARAICRNAVLATARSLRVKPAPTEAWTDNRVEARWREYLDVADDALRAMRDPTAEMEAAFYTACDERGNVLWKHGYRALIDAALAEKPDGN